MSEITDIVGILYKINNNLSALNSNVAKLGAIQNNSGKTLTQMNWNLGKMANPGLEKEYPDTEKELGSKKGEKV